MYKLELQWKEFNIDLQTLDAELRISYPLYIGNQAHSVLELWFNEEPNQADKDSIQAIWDAIDSNQHPMAQSYKSAAQVKTEREVQKASAKAKLVVLGLTEDELKALLG
jgi:hypothetical protein